MGGDSHPTTADPLLTVDNASVEYATPSGKVQAVSELSFQLAKGETLGLVGESGCGKSTTGRAIVGLTKLTGGRITFDGADMAAMTPKQQRRIRSELQMIFQDPISSLNPWRKVLDIVIEPLAIWDLGTKDARVQRARELLEIVGLDPDAVGARRAPRLSGGQCQRVSIARALALDPRLLICDEAVSALDVSVQAQIVNLLEEMRERFHLTMLFISHDLAVVRAVSDRIAVMYMGKLCEIGPTVNVYSSPRHPYTALLHRSVPRPDLKGRGFALDVSDEPEHVPSPTNPPSGCRFRTRCPRATDRCATEVPEMIEIGRDHFVACHFPLDDP